MGQDKVAKTLETHKRLIQTYGERELKPRREPMRELISTMLSHRTTHADEELAYNRMLERFPTWEAVRDAPVLMNSLKLFRLLDIQAAKRPIFKKRSP